FYHYQKTCDVVLLTTTFFFAICMGNQPQQMLHLTTQPAAASTAFTNLKTTAATNTTPIKPVKKKDTKFSKKALRQLLFQKIRVLRKTYKDTSQGGRIALVFLAVLVALLLLYLVAALSCSISCSGADGLAIVVAILGVSLITFLLVRVIRRITRGPRQPDEIAPATSKLKERNAPPLMGF
ncbi:MAG TPA: hypothetical protein VM010_01255, partial [Chitinophagaceae bacterium]|nr:hypothetical protein [Chitinophagaceae bacterium]